MKKGTALVICSGGLDSTVALWDALRKYERVEALSFRYGQNHQRRENAAVRRICEIAGVQLTMIDLAFIGRHFRSALLGGVIPQERYSAANMSSTVVPFRNGIMLSVAAGFAESKGLKNIVLGNHAGDHFLYPDCREGFISSIADAIKAGTQAGISVKSPFCNKTKADIVRIGNKIGAPLELTYSCYTGGKRHCGGCGTCIERKEAFKAAGVADRTQYDF